MNAYEYGKMDVVNNKRLIILLQYTKAKSNGVYIFKYLKDFNNGVTKALCLHIFSNIVVCTYFSTLTVFLSIEYFLVKPSNVY